MGVAIKSLSHFIPETRITNDELAIMFGTTADWILEKTGIVERRVFHDGATSDLIVNATKVCLAQVKMQVSDIECIIVATMTPDFLCPSTAAVVHKKLGAKTAAWGFDVMAACGGFVYGLQMGAAMIESKQYKNVLVCAADKMTSIIDPMDKKTRLIFGDGAGVVLLEYTEKPAEVELIGSVCGLDSTDLMSVSALDGGSQNPLTQQTLLDGNQFMKFTTRGIFSGGVQLFKRVILEIMEKHNLTFDDIDYIVPHQANKRMLESLADALSLPISKFIINIENVGNTNAASIPIALSEAVISKQIKPGMRVLLTGVGAGFTYGASIVEFKK